MTSSEMLTAGRDRTINADCRARLIAYYLPQFHPIPENDEWWGKGFTEWTNVAKARPLFRGHQQPRLPADLGFYDLRLPETREDQARLAQSCGIEGFCYWHYWFGDGRRILERPFNEVLKSGKPDFPFCLAWANQTWTGIWHGESNRVLMLQTYPGRADEEAHFLTLMPAFSDPRYITVDGKPLFCVYQPLDLPSPEAFVAHWRELAVQAGLPGLFLVAMWHDGEDIRLQAFDAVTPNGPADFFGSDRRLASRLKGRVSRSRLGRWWSSTISRQAGSNTRKPYSALIRHGLTEKRFSLRFIPCVVPNWDNSPRSGRRGIVIEGSTPETFEWYLSEVTKKVQTRLPNHKIIFLKAWNEWAEGNYVEPDRNFGAGYLEAIRRAIRNSASSSSTV